MTERKRPSPPGTTSRLGQDAEVMAKIFSKGQRLYVEGKLAYREYTGKDDVKRNTTEIVVSDFKKLEAADK